MSPKDQTVAEYIAQFFVEKSVPAVFQLSGGMIAFITDAIDRNGAPRIVNNRHEQGAGFAAEGLSRVLGIPGVAMGTSGPGATNLITPIASCFFDSVPTIFITGQVRRDEQKKNADQRQNGFQELDICEVVKPIAKRVYKIHNSKQVSEILQEAWDECQSGRPGPVLIDIPIDIQQESMPHARLRESSFDHTWASFENKDFKEVFCEIKSLIESASNPLVLVGGGVRSSGVSEKIRKFLHESNLPYVVSLMGIDGVDHRTENFVGFIGSYGNSWANIALDKSDVLLVLGSRLDVRQTGANIDNFTRNKKIIRVDIDSAELSGRIKGDISVDCHLEQLIDFFLECKFELNQSELSENAKANKRIKPQESEQVSDLALNPTIAIEAIAEIFKYTNGYIVDVGQHQMWAAQSLSLMPNQRFITSGGLGAMGFALPAAIGACIGKPGRWVVIVGDGCLQLSSQELQTISHYELPITICLFNNNQHGMVAQFQEENMESRFVGTRFGYSNPNFKLLASSYGINNYVRVTDMEDLQQLEHAIVDFSGGPALVEIIIEDSAKALPKMSYKAE
jgi:acetolactate synthase I/II/III large subunit